MQILGIDVGGTGVKGAIVETATGKLTSERLRVETPNPATPESIGLTVKDVQDWPKALQEVTVDDVMTVAHEVLNRDHAVTGYLVPKAKEAAQ